MDESVGTPIGRERPSLVLEQVEVGQLLGLAALALSAAECPMNANGDCDGCNAARKLFWDLSNSLDQEVRVWYQHELSERGVPLPDAPWEDIDVTPTPER